jgi:hypothetical protein
MSIIEQEIGALLRQKGMTLGAVESATGGLISHRITNVPGSSDYYKGSVTAYSNEAKVRIVGVNEATIFTLGYPLKTKRTVGSITSPATASRTNRTPQKPLCGGLKNTCPV